MKNQAEAIKIVDELNQSPVLNNQKTGSRIEIMALRQKAQELVALLQNAEAEAR